MAVNMRPFRAANQGEIDAYYRKNNNRSGYTGYSPAQTHGVIKNVRANPSHLSKSALPPTQYVNPKFHPAITARGNAGGGLLSGLVRGRMSQVQAEPTQFPGTGHKYRRSVQFLYNPQAITMNYSFDMNKVPPESADPTSLSTPAYAATGQTVSWRLYFNRQFEVAEDPEHMGVLTDVQALEYFMGAHDGLGLSATQLIVVFGNTPKLKPFGFGGYIANLDVEYLNFSYRMIPTVAMVNVSLVRQWIPSNVTYTNADVAGGGGLGGDKKGMPQTGESGAFINRPTPFVPIPGGGRIE